MITVLSPASAKPAPCHILTHPSLNIIYTFRVLDDEVQVIHSVGGMRRCYTVPVEEARGLWRRLCAKGYRCF